MIKTITHGDHSHNVKVSKETVCGLNIDSTENEQISGAFGWDDVKFKSMCRALRSFNNFQKAAEDLNKDLPKSTKISVLVDFLKSHTFTELGTKIETPNDYFMLGFVWSIVFLDEDRKVFSGAMKGADLMGLLGELMKKRG